MRSFRLCAVLALSSGWLNAAVLTGELEKVSTGTSVKVRADVTLVAKTTYTKIGEWADAADSDGDGVPDWRDWCENSPAGVSVVKIKKIRGDKGLQIYEGCTGEGTFANGEKWLFPKGEFHRVLPTYNSYECGIKHDSKDSARVVKAGTQLTIESNRTLKKVETSKEGHRTTAWVLEAQELGMKTAGGTALAVHCFGHVNFLNGSEDDLEKVGGEVMLPYKGYPEKTNTFIEGYGLRRQNLTVVHPPISTLPVPGERPGRQITFPGSVDRSTSEWWNGKLNAAVLENVFELVAEAPPEVITLAR